LTIDKVIFFVVLIEAVVENLKLVYDSANHRLNVDVILSLAISIGACLAFGVDIFKLNSFEALWAPLGSLLTGIVISRGANFVHDILGAINVEK